MPRKGGGLTPQEKTFVKHAAATGSIAYAGYRAGYVDPEKQSYRVIARPEVASAVRTAQMKRLENEAMPLAVNFMIETLKDPNAKTRDKIEISKLTLSYTAGRNADAAEKAPEDMTAEEIAARLAELRAQQQRFLEGIPDADIVGDDQPENGDIFG